MRVTYADAAKILARCKATRDHVVEETLYVLDVDTAFAVAGKVLKEAYATARHLIGVARLAFPEQLIELSSRQCRRQHRRTRVDLRGPPIIWIARGKCGGVQSDIITTGGRVVPIFMRLSPRSPWSARAIRSASAGPRD
jgi:hypothetical protein